LVSLLLIDLFGRLLTGSGLNEPVHPGGYA
jgi:hypothetical protein